MRIGTVREIKAHEHRIALTPAGARELVAAGHEVVVERGAGAGVRHADEDYEAAGAVMLDAAADVFDRADMVVKVKEPQPNEVVLLRPGQLLFTYLHLAADQELTRALTVSGATCVAYETVEDEHGSLPLLAPMSEVAGRLAAHAAADVLWRTRGGRGVLLGGVPGVAPATVVIVGGGVVGTNAATIASGARAEVHVLDRSMARLRELDALFEGRIQTHFATAQALEDLLPRADVVIGAVLIHGARAPRVIRREQLALLADGAGLVDVSIDQGGCFETSRPTTHSSPTYEVDGVVHYCVANMPAAVPATSTAALTNATLPYVLQLADEGTDALRRDPRLGAGLNVVGGAVTCEPVARAAGMAVTPREDALAAAAMAA